MTPNPDSKSIERLRLFYWSETTAALSFETGIQRVVRHLARALAQGHVDIVPVGWESRRRVIRDLVPGQQNGIGRVGEVVATAAPPACRLGSWLFVPEIPVTAVLDGVNPMRLGRAYGLRTAAIVHDLIPIKLARDYDEEASRFYGRYFPMLANADLVFATTDYVAGDLRQYLQSCGLIVPKIAVCPLPAQFTRTKRCLSRNPSPIRTDDLKLLTVSTWEPRKNLPRLLRAIAEAKARTGKRIHLTVVGRRGGFPAYDAEVEANLRQMSDVVTIEYVSDDALLALYASHHASVYPSFEEGFGLPILESLWLATPCVCHNASSMAELAPGGGTMMIDMLDEDAIRDAICRLVTQPELLSQLEGEIAARSLASWGDYAADVYGHLSSSDEGRFPEPS